MKGNDKRKAIRAALFGNDSHLMAMKQERMKHMAGYRERLTRLLESLDEGQLQRFVEKHKEQHPELVKAVINYHNEKD
jgi:uncharacterized protein YutE (UPF0331/DUF86 family)